MNVHELPLVLFTVIGQMCVGAFLTLGVIQLALSLRHDAKTVDRITEPIVYAIGPALVLGLIVSMFHMNDVSHTLNVVRNWESSWLSREILFGIGFAAFGFLFAIMQWFRIASLRVRQAIAAVTALFGIALVWAMAQIYYSVRTIPAWHTWIVPFQFFCTTIILGSLAVGCALLITSIVRLRTTKADAALTVGTVDEDPADETPVGGSTPVPAESGRAGVAVAAKPNTSVEIGLASHVRRRVREINATTTEEEWSLTTQILKWIAVVTAVTGVVVLISYTFHVSSLSAGDATAQASAEVFTGTLFVLRLGLLALAAVLLALFTFRTADRTARERPGQLATLMTVAIVLAFVAEVLGRFFHYASMFRIGI